MYDKRRGYVVNVSQLRIGSVQTLVCRYPSSEAAMPRETSFCQCLTAMQDPENLDPRYDAWAAGGIQQQPLRNVQQKAVKGRD